MSPGVGYALLSLLAAGVLDVVYARYAGKRPVIGLYLVTIGGVVIAGHSAVLALLGAPVHAGALALHNPAYPKGMTDE